MAVVNLSKVVLSRQWRQQFAEALIKLRPDMNPDAIDELSDSAHLKLANLSPGEAAELCNQGSDLSVHCSVNGARGG
jgi:hypothetical protein